MQGFPDILAGLVLSPHELLIAGDINLHWNKVDTCTDCASIRETLNMPGLVQHVTKATHLEGNILDWVISRRQSRVDTVRVGGLLSDHFAIHCALQTSKAPVPNHSWRIGSLKTSTGRPLMLTFSGRVYTLTRPPSLWARWLNSTTDCSVSWWTGTLQNKPGWWLWDGAMCLGLLTDIKVAQNWEEEAGEEMAVLKVDRALSDVHPPARRRQCHVQGSQEGVISEENYRLWVRPKEALPPHGWPPSAQRSLLTANSRLQQGSCRSLLCLLHQ